MKLINYKGVKYGDEKLSEIAECDVFVFPTFYSNECFPLVLLEAMQQAKPIVTSSEGGIPDIVKDGINGHVVANGKPEEIALRIETLLNNKDLARKMGSIGRYMYESKFTLESFEHNMLGILIS